MVDYFIDYCDYLFNEYGGKVRYSLIYIHKDNASITVLFSKPSILISGLYSFLLNYIHFRSSL